MVFESISLKIALPLQILINAWKASANCLNRPKNLELSFSVGAISFTDHQNKVISPSMPVVRVTNNSENKLIVDLAGIYIGRESYKCLCQGNKYYALTNPQTSAERRLHSANKVLTKIRENWGEHTATLEIAGGETLELPFLPIKESMKFVDIPNNRSRLFMASKKLTVSLQFGSKSYDYGINRTRVLERLVNWSAFQIND
jgi:hypothetical protein